MKLVIVDLDYVTDPRRAYELPSAEELGRVTLEASGVHFAKYGLSAVDQPNRKQFIGQAILDAIRRKP